MANGSNGSLTSFYWACPICNSDQFVSGFEPFTSMCSSCGHENKTDAFRIQLEPITITYGLDFNLGDK